MGKYEKLFLKIIESKSDKNIAFNDLCQLLQRLRFELRIKGSHYIFRKEGIMEKPNLQKDGNKAKSYQIRQVRELLIKYHIKGD